MSIRHRLGATAALSLVALVMACGGSRDSRSDGALVGKVEGSNAFIAIASTPDGETIAYVCDGASISQWFRGPATGERIDLVAGGARLQATVKDGRAAGTVTLAGGSPLRFTAAPAGHEGGFWRAEDRVAQVGGVGGWIKLPDGQQRGLFVFVGGPPPPLPGGIGVGQTSTLYYYNYYYWR